MSSADEVYAAWAPDDAAWSAWVKPVLFAHMKRSRLSRRDVGPLSPLDPPPWMAAETAGTAWLLDLPGTASVRLGAGMMRLGVRPAPLFNGAASPSGLGLVRVDGIIDAMEALSEHVRSAPLASDAPPAFLLDAGRMVGGWGRAGPGEFDNRWLVFEQDLPSGRYLLSHRINRAIVVHETDRATSEDLSHVLLRWQRAGIAIHTAHLGEEGGPREIEVPRPMLFGWAFRRALVTLGLRRNSAGGFGAVVPTPSSGGRFG
jgi:hypothetical protein